MNDWQKLADKLESVLLANAPALLLHFLSTASHDAVAALAGDALPNCRRTQASVVAILLDRQKAASALGDHA